jgi:CubicO group peptidase (beta-lactamase class C family)
MAVQDGAVSRSVIDSAVDSLVTQHALGRGVPGAAVVIVSHGQVVVQRGFGVRDITTRLPVTPETAFNLASLTKPFTAIAVLRLAREGRLRLDAPAREYLSWLPARYADVTVRQLLTHTSGVARDLRRDNLDDPGPEEYRRRLDSAAASAAPGSRWEYSNTGYTILGWVVEAVAGVPLIQFLRREVFDSLKMDQVEYRVSPDGHPERARPHGVVDGRTRSTTWITGGFASGGMIASAADLAAFGVALQKELVLTEAEARLAWSPAILGNGQNVRFRMFTDTASYGFGWFVTAFGGHRLLTHGGAIEGFSSNLYHFPDRRLTIAVLANSKNRDDGKAPVDLLAQELATFCLARASCQPRDSSSRF